MPRVVRLKLNVRESDSYPTKQDCWKRIYQISDDCWKAANHIASGQFMNDQLIRRVYARKKIDSKDKEQTTAIENEIFSKDGFFGTKRQATTERDIKDVFPNIPSCITNPLNQIVFQSYVKDKKDLLMGKKSLRTYKQGMPFPITTSHMNFITKEDDKHYFIWSLGSDEKMMFEIYYGQDRANYRSTIEKVIKDEIKISTSSIQLKDKQLYLLLVVNDVIQEKPLDPEIFVGVDLGINIPAYCALNNGKSRMSIGSKEDLFRNRTQIANRRRRLQKGLVGAKSGHGRKRKMKALDRFRELEKNFVHSYNHFVSKRVIDFAIQNNASMIKLENLEGFDKDQKDSIILRNWSYFELQQMIIYKAKKFGIQVKMIDPAYTSQTCSKCGHLEDGQRLSQSEFVCKNCGYKENADYNAAVNIAKSEITKSKKTKVVVEKKEKRTKRNY